MIFAVLDVSLAVNLCINLHFLVERPALAVRLDLWFRSVYFFYNGENRAKIGQGTAEILWRVYTKFTFFSAIFRLSSTLKLYNFYTVQDRGIQSAYEMLRMKRAF